MLGEGPISGAPISAADLPTPDLTIPNDKLSGYLLNLEHPDGGSKAEFFLARGFSLTSIEIFVSALFHHGCPAHLVSEAATEFGTKFVYEGPMPMPDDSTWRVRSVWFKATDDSRRLLVTAYTF